MCVCVCVCVCVMCLITRVLQLPVGVSRSLSVANLPGLCSPSRLCFDVWVRYVYMYQCIVQGSRGGGGGGRGRSEGDTSLSQVVQKRYVG